MVRWLLVFCVLILLPTATAGYTIIRTFADKDGTVPFIEDTGGMISIYVVVNSFTPLMAVEFAAPVPGCFAGASWVSDTEVIGVAIGDSQNGVSIGFGQCLSAPIHVLTVNIMTQGQTETCCLYPVVEHPYTGDVAAVDCSPAVIVAQGAGGVVSSRLLWVGDPSPPDNATEQPVNTTLSWGVNACGLYVLMGTPMDWLFFGTTPDPPLVSWPKYAMQEIPQPHDPGPLAPSTTYYWKVKHWDPIGGVESPVWQFTTEAAVPVEPTTWGRVKALYRD